MPNEHQTFPGEQQEVKQPDLQPETTQPNDPQEPQVPNEGNQIVPDEFPPGENSPTPPPIPPNIP